MEDIFHYHNPVCRLGFIKQLALLKSKDLQDMTEKVGRQKWSKLTWVLLSAMKQVGLSDEDFSSLVSQIDDTRGFRDGKRFDRLVQFFISVLDEGLYTHDEMQTLVNVLTETFSKKVG